MKHVSFFGRLRPPRVLPQQEHPGPETSPQLDPVPGERLAWLLLNSNTWVHRRVEALRMDDSGASRWHISHDITIWEGRQIVGSGRRVVVPLGALRKGALRRVDTHGPDGRGMSILGTEENTKHAVEMLAFLAGGLLTPQTLAGNEYVVRIEKLVRCPPQDSAAEAKLFTEWLETVKSEPRSLDEKRDLELFEQLATALSSSFLLLVEIDEAFVGTRVVLKYSRDDDVASKQATSPYDKIPKAIAIDLPDFGLASSFHLEIGVPKGLRVSTLVVDEFDGDGTLFASHRDESTGHSLISHVACAPNHRLATAQGTLEVVPTEQGIVAFCLYGVLVVLAIAVLAAVGVYIPNSLVPTGSTYSTSSVSILLIGPALFLSWMSRTPEHFLVARVLRPFRAILIVLAFVLVILAGMAAVVLMPSVRELAWIVVYSCLLWSIAQVIYLQGSMLSASRRTLVQREDEQL